MARFHTVVTAVSAKRPVLDGREVVVQAPKALKAEITYVEATSKDSSNEMEEAHKRMLELLHHRKQQWEDRQRTEIAWEIIQPLAEEDQFPQANYAFANGVMPLEWTTSIESPGQHGVSEWEGSRHIQW
jgi:hypothetical protein